MRSTGSFAGAEGDFAGLRSLVVSVHALASASAGSLARRVRLGARGTRPAGERAPNRGDALLALESIIYELLDAHQTTTALADGLEWDPEWSEHLECLRRLQRVSREVLSASSVPSEQIVDRAR